MPVSVVIWTSVARSVTRTRHEAAWPFVAVAVMFAVPVFNAVTVPSAATFATVSSSLSHVSVLSLALEGAIVAVSFFLAPGRICASPGRETLPTGVNTLTLSVFDLLARPLKSFEVTVMVT